MVISALGVVSLAVTLQPESVSGVVRDSISLEPVAFADVAVAMESGEFREAVTDRHGTFVVAGVRPGTGRIEVAGLGYRPWTLEYLAPPPDPLRILLRRAPIGIDSLVVKAYRRSGDPLSASTGAFVIDTAFARLQPVVVEADVMRVATMSASVSAPSDYAAIPRIRGGSGGDTPVMLDGVRLFNPFHFGGIVSAFNAEAIQRVTVLTDGGSESQAIGSLSGAFDIVTRDGARDRVRTSGAIGLASTRVSIEGPIGEATSFLVAGRRSYIDIVSGRRIPYSFGDVHTKVTRDFGAIRRLSLTGYLNDERLNSQPTDADLMKAGEGTRTTWGNRALALHYRDRLGPRTLVDVSVGDSHFSSDFAMLRWQPRAGDTAATTVTGVSAVMRESRATVRAAHHGGFATWEAGAQVVRFSGRYRGAEPNRRDGVGMVADSLDADALQTRVAGYANAHIPITRELSARAGMRVDHFTGLATTLAPFAGATYARDNWQASLNASRHNQALYSLRDEEHSGASVWALDMLVTPENGPVSSNTQVAAGWEGSSGELRLRVEAYTRWLTNLRLPVLGENPSMYAALYNAKREAASGTVRGIETSWSWARTGRGSVMGSYRWATASRTVGGVTYTPRFHRSHELEVSAGLERGVSIWSLRLAARSGQPTTHIVAMLPFPNYKSSKTVDSVVYDNVLHLAGDYNGTTLPSYFRMDVGWRTVRKVSWFGGGSLTPYVSVVNLLSVPNVLFRVYDWDNGTTTISYGHQLPIFPFFGVEFTF